MQDLAKFGLQNKVKEKYARREVGPLPQSPDVRKRIMKSIRQRCLHKSVATRLEATKVYIVTTREIGWNTIQKQSLGDMHVWPLNGAHHRSIALYRFLTVFLPFPVACRNAGNSSVILTRRSPSWFQSASFLFLSIF
jgi:hypothetical protein